MKTIFVSSTFQDMHYERDIIHDRVTPALNAVARQYGESVSFCDLRWGVNTGELESEEGSRKVLSVCLEEIDRCRPYMLVILGDRYGWIPDQRLIADAASRARFALEELEQSVTGLEIEYGALSNPEQLERTLFYFRAFEGEVPASYGPENPHHAAKLKELKERIRKLAGSRLRTYTLGWDPEENRPVGLDQFAALVESDVRRLMEQEWKETATLTPYQKDQRGQWDYAAQKARQFSAREGFVSDCIAMLDGGTHLLALQGESGTGKSTLIARLAQVLRDRGDQVLPIFCATTPLCNNSQDLVRYIIYDLEDRLGQPHFIEQPREGQPTEKEWTDRLEDLVAAYNAQGKGRLIILIDAVDQLFANSGREKLRFVPYNLSPNVQMVLSCLSEFHLSRSMEVKVVEPLASENRPEIIRGILGFLGRELDKPVIDVMVQKTAAHSPLYLSLVVQRLTMMNKADFDEIVAQGDGMAAITRHQIQLVEGCSDTLEGMCVDILAAASQHVGGPFVRTAAEYLAVSRHGLRERDLERLLTAQEISWSGLDFARFVQYLNTFFILREDGRYDFAHQSIRRGVLDQCSDVPKLHREILAHLLTLDSQDEVRVREFGYHCILADNKQAFVDYVQTFGAQESVVSFVARDAHDLAMADGGTWLKELFRQGLELGVNHPWINWINFDLSAAFGDGQAELELKQQVLEVGLELARQVNDRNGTAQSRRDLFIGYDNVGDICEALGGRVHLERALELYQKGLEYRETLAREQATAEARRDLTLSYERMGGIYQTLGGQANLERALELNQKSLELRETLARELGTAKSRRDLTISYERVGWVYQALGGQENLKRALELYQRVLTCSEALARELGTAQSRRDLTISYDYVGRVYQTLGGRDNLERALVLYQKCLELAEALTRELGTAQSRRDLTIVYNRTGAVYQALGGRDNLERALELYRKSLELREALARELSTAESRQDLAVTYDNVGLVYQALGGQDNLEQSLALYQKGLELRETLAWELGTAESRQYLTISYNNVGRIYRILGGRANLERALILYQKGLELSEALARELGTAQSRRDLTISYDNVGRVYQALGGRENLERALALYQKCLELAEALARELGTAQSRRDLSISCNNVGRVYRALEGRDNLERALVLYQKGMGLAEALARELGTAQSRRDLAISYNNVGRVYQALGGRDNLERALTLYQKGLELDEALARELGIAESRRDLAVTYDNVGWVYQALGGKENLERALALYQKGLEYRENLARKLSTVSAYDELAVSYSRVGGCLPVGSEERQRYLTQFLELSEWLLQQTRSRRHQEFIEKAHRLLEEAQQSTQPAASSAKRSLWSRLFGRGKP